MRGLYKRVAYHEVDQMRYLYHGHYAAYYHASRTAFLREIQLDDAHLEDMGIILPVVHLTSYYIKPALYDDVLLIRSELAEVSAAKLYFKHYIYCNEELINKGESTLAVVDLQSRKPIKIDPKLRERLERVKCIECE